MNISRSCWAGLERRSHVPVQEKKGVCLQVFGSVAADGVDYDLPMEGQHRKEGDGLQWESRKERADGAGSIGRECGGGGTGTQTLLRRPGGHQWTT